MSEKVGETPDAGIDPGKKGAHDADDYAMYIESIDVFLKHFGRLGMCVAIAGASAAVVFFSRVLFPPFPLLLTISGAVLFIFSALLSILVAGDTYVRLSQFIPRLKPKKYLNHQWMERLLLWFLLIFSFFVVVAASVIAHAMLLA